MWDDEKKNGTRSMTANTQREEDVGSLPGWRRRAQFGVREKKKGNQSQEWELGCLWSQSFTVRQMVWTSEPEEVYEVLGWDGGEAAVGVVGRAGVSRVLREKERSTDLTWISFEFGRRRLWMRHIRLFVHLDLHLMSIKHVVMLQER